MVGDTPLFSYGWGDRELLPEYLTMYSYGNNVKGCLFISTDELEQADPYMHIYRHPYKNGEKKGGMKCKVFTIDGGF